MSPPPPAADSPSLLTSSSSTTCHRVCPAVDLFTQCCKKSEGGQMIAPMFVVSVCPPPPPCPVHYTRRGERLLPLRRPSHIFKRMITRSQWCVCWLVSCKKQFPGEVRYVSVWLYSAGDLTDSGSAAEGQSMWAAGRKGIFFPASVYICLLQHSAMRCNFFLNWGGIRSCIVTFLLLLFFAWM